MAQGTRWGAVGLALAILFGSAASDGPRARAEGETAAPAPAAWVLDVRVVRVDTNARMTVEAASPWEPSGRSGSWTKLPWAELLEGLKSRGTTTLLCEQRVTVSDDGTANIRQLRKRPVEQRRNRSDNPGGTTELWETSYAEVGVSGEVSLRGGARSLTKYEFRAEWEEGSTANGGVAFGSTTWRADYGPSLRDGETLVLPYRSQSLPDDKTSPTIEVYVLLTCARVDRK